MFLTLILLKFLFILLPILISVAFITLMERKVLSIIGFRLGPNKVGAMGLIQPISDALKLSNKEVNILMNYSYFFYYFSSLLFFFCSSLIWFTFMQEPVSISFKLSFMLFFLVLGLNSLNSILLGWSTFSKYSLLGSLRTVAQLISYESVLYLILFFFIYFYGLFNFYSMNFYTFFLFSFLMPICFYFWFPSILAELNRTPYDFSEGESELVSGFNTEFGSLGFTLIFLSEYSMILFFCVLTSFIFFWGFSAFFFFLSFFFIIWIRSVLPRYRFDKLMYLSWKFFIPFLTVYIIFCFVFIM